MTLPWDEFTPDERPAPVPTTPPPAPVPSSPRPASAPPVVDWGEMLDDAWPTIRDQAIDYAKASVREIAKGQTVDVLHPTVTATTATGRELVVADAKSRSGRTFVQGLTIDLIAAVAAVIAVLSGMDPFAGETWVIIGALFVKTIVQTIASYVMRLKVTPTIKTPGQKMAVMPIPRPIVEEQSP